MSESLLRLMLLFKDSTNRLFIVGLLFAISSSNKGKFKLNSTRLNFVRFSDLTLMSYRVRVFSKGAVIERAAIVKSPQLLIDIFSAYGRVQFSIHRAGKFSRKRLPSSESPPILRTTKGLSLIHSSLSSLYTLTSRIVMLFEERLSS